jgi:hypothetical protein
VVLAGSAIGVAVLARSLAERRTTELASAVQELEHRIDSAHAALVERVAELSAMPRLAPALATDAATVRDLLGQELALRPRSGESILLAQRFRDGRVVSLLGVPQGSEVLPGPSGDTVRIEGGQLVLSRTVDIAPSDRADEVTGLLSIRHVLDAQALARALPTQTEGARLTLGEAELSLGASPPPSSARMLTGTLHVPDRSPKTEATLAVASDARVRPLGGLAVLLALCAGGVALRAVRVKRTGQSNASLAPTSGGGLVGGTSDAALGSAGTVAAPSQPSMATSALSGSIALAATAAAGMQPGGEERMGRYAIVRRLGQGGMADVFLARAEGEAGFGKLVAFKVMQPSFAAYPVAVELFLDEARLVAGLDHPNIVQTYDLGRAGDRYFIAMEYVDGIDLARLVELLHQRGERMPVSYALAILCKICDGLHAAHTAKGPDGQPLHLVHRDVKSANVFLSRTGAVKVGDFGIAKASHRLRMSRTEMGEVKGTPGYMSPEQRLGLEVDLRADVYGVGCIAYEALSGQMVNLDYVALAARGTEGWPHLAPLSSLRADVPGDLDAIVFMALAYAREARFMDCAALERALREVGASTGIAQDNDMGAWVRAQLERRDTRARASV